MKHFISLFFLTMSVALAVNPGNVQVNSSGQYSSVPSSTIYSNNPIPSGTTFSNNGTMTGSGTFNFGSGTVFANPWTINLAGQAMVFEGDSITMGYNTVAPATDNYGYLFFQDAFASGHVATVVTTGSTSGLSATLTVGSGTGLTIGMQITGNANIPAGTQITAISGTTVTMSIASTATVSGNVTFSTLSNDAVSGSFIQPGSNGGDNCPARYVANVKPFRPTANGGLGGPRAFLFLMAGTNDIGAGGRTASQVIADLNTYITTAQGDGFIVVVSTILPRNDGSWTSTMEGYRQTVNQAIRNHTVTANMFWDGARVLNTVNSTYYVDSVLHPSVLGHVLLERELNNVMTSNGGFVVPEYGSFEGTVTANRNATVNGSLTVNGTTGGTTASTISGSAGNFTILNIYNASAGGYSLGFKDSTNSILEGVMGYTTSGTWLPGLFSIFTPAASPIAFGINNTEAGRFTSTGDFSLVGNLLLPTPGLVTSGTSSTGIVFGETASEANAGDSYVVDNAGVLSLDGKSGSAINLGVNRNNPITTGTGLITDNGNLKITSAVAIVGTATLQVTPGDILGGTATAGCYYGEATTEATAANSYVIDFNGDLYEDAVSGDTIHIGAIRNNPIVFGTGTDTFNSVTASTVSGFDSSKHLVSLTLGSGLGLVSGTLSNTLAPAAVNSHNASFTATVGVNVFTGSTAAQTVTLPTPVSQTGIIYVKNQSSVTVTVASNSGSQIFTTSAQASTTMNSGDSLILFSDGTYWNK